MAAATATRRTATTTRKAASIPTIHQLADGRLILTDIPFMIPGYGRNGRLMGGRGLGWEYAKDIDGMSGWVHDSEPGAAAEVVNALAEYGVAVVDLSGNGAAPKATTRKAAPTATTRKAAPTATTRKAAPTATTRKVAPKATAAEAAAQGSGSTLAAKIAGALAADGVAPEIIAAAIAAATAKADEIALSATATVSAAPVKGGRKVATGKAAPVKVTRKAATARMSATAEGWRVLAVDAGVPLADAAKAARQGLSRAGIAGVSIRKDGRNLVAYRADGAGVSADIDAIVIGAVAAVAE